MPYCTQQDLIDRFGLAELIQLTDRTNRPATAVDPAPVGRAIEDATALIDGYLAKLYALPLVSPPPVLTKAACDVARYYLHGKAAEKDDAVSRAYKEAVDWLKDVSRNIVTLNVAGVAPAQAGGGTVKANPSNRVFTRDTLRSA